MIDIIVCVITIVVLVLTSFRYYVNKNKKRGNRRIIREMIITSCLGILWIYLSIFINMNMSLEEIPKIQMSGSIFGEIVMLIGTIFVIILVVHQNIRTYKEMYRTYRITKKELLIKYTFTFINLLLMYVFINICIYFFNNNAFYFAISQSENFTSITSMVVTFFYFTVATITTLGFGDIFPVSMTAKFLVAMQNLLSYLSISIMVSLILVENRRRVKKDIDEKEKALIKEVLNETKK